MSNNEELRAMAESVGLAMPQAATLMMGAADAIDRLDGENAKLREELQAHTTHAVVYADESTDCATGYCTCELCGRAIDMWDAYCRHCGAKVLQPARGIEAER